MDELSSRQVIMLRVAEVAQQAYIRAILKGRTAAEAYQQAEHDAAQQWHRELFTASVHRLASQRN
ncbi:MAG: hypothetical protein NUW01_14290 [Gemmatimonadaceae bacterium]|nr:hypothetical protein [Gemmatimonadaceae bacterium]